MKTSDEFVTSVCSNAQKLMILLLALLCTSLAMFLFIVPKAMQHRHVGAQNGVTSFLMVHFTFMHPNFHDYETYQDENLKRYVSC